MRACSKDHKLENVDIRDTLTLMSCGSHAISSLSEPCQTYTRFCYIDYWIIANLGLVTCNSSEFTRVLVVLS